MMKFLNFLFILLVFGAIIGFIFAMFWDVPRPSNTTEQVIELEVQ